MGPKAAFSETCPQLPSPVEELNATMANAANAHNLRTRFIAAAVKSDWIVN
jgi:hypothetical protein